MLSILIPTLNEADNLRRTVEHARAAAGGDHVFEIIVCDCGSRDQTVSIARELQVDRVLNGATCRADALNRAAARARGDVLLFLHADSILPDAFAHKIRRALHHGTRVAGGAFDFEFGPRPQDQPFSNLCLSWVVMCNRIRFRWTGNFYGDQSIFVRRDVFDRCGGFPSVRLMEDLRFCARMRRFGRTVILRPPVVTSPRRFLARGVLRQFAQDLTLLACESLGLCPGGLWDHYNGLNHGAETTVASGEADARGAVR